MKEATLKIRISNKGNPVAEIFYDGQKEILQNFKSDRFKAGESYKVEFEKTNIDGRANKTRLRVRFQNEFIYDSRPDKPAATGQHGAAPQTGKPADSGFSRRPKKLMKQAKNIDPKFIAKAPYNFVPLNDVVIEAPLDKKDRPCDFDTYHEKRLTGVVDLAIETQTPMYIRDSMTEAEVAKEDKEVNSNFFSPSGNLQIPGSSLRGMVRSMVEITSFGKFGDFDERKLYYRSIPDANYRQKMADSNPAYRPKAKAGYLKKEGGKFFISPASEVEGITFYRVEDNDLRGKNIKINMGKTTYATTKIIFKNDTPKVHKNHRTPLFYGKVRDIKNYPADNNTPAGWHSGYLVRTGWIPRKHMQWVICEDSANKSNGAAKLYIGKNLERDYKNDVNRDDGADLFAQLAKHREGVPCFYITNESGDIASFGQTGMFRLAYEKSIGEHIPNELLNEKIIDFAEAIFGNEKTFAGRVFFEDAFLDEEKASVEMGEKFPQILSGPKPTTYQHYLIQTNDNAKVNKRTKRNGQIIYSLKDLADYNKANYIRGNKLYWHKSGEVSRWTGDPQKVAEDQKKEKSKRQHTCINPVHKGKTFVGKIRFENLSPEELGALLFALKLPDNCYHKLGMGKPLGLGSIKITPTLKVSDRDKRYKDLFAEWQTDSQATENPDEYIKTFENYVLEKLQTEGSDEIADALWKTPRLKELKVLLNFETGKALENKGLTRYMTIEGKNEFRDRPILPTPSGIKS